MARKTATFVADQEGRDKGKRFLLTEMPASQSEMWALRAFMALARSGVDIPDEFRNQGMAAIAVVGIQALSALPFQELQPLLDELFGCVQFCPDDKNPQFARALVESDIEEITTRMRLRLELIKLHFDFFEAAALLKRAPRPAAASPA